MRLSLGYPSAEFEKQLYKQIGKRKTTNKQQPVFNPSDMTEVYQKVDGIHVSDAIIDYLQSLISQTRSNGNFVNGLSPRAGLQWLQAAKALAFIERRDAVLPEDIKLLAPFTAAHRLYCNDGSASTDEIAKILEATEIL